VLSPELTQKPVASGAMELENPTAILSHYGYADDGPLAPQQGDVQSKEHNVEATKTEPDKLTYLVLESQTGPDAAVNYGTHFLFQGHENGPKVDGKPQGSLTRINLDADILSDGMKDIYGTGVQLKTTWVTVHDTDKNGTTPFDANKLAKAAMATPMKRPENGVFRPGTDFAEFYFTQTGDTNAETEAKAEFGGFGGIFKLTQAAPSAAEGRLSIVFRGTVDHTGFDNLVFASADELMIVEDAGDKLHGQRKFFDCGYVLDLNKDYAQGTEPLRFMGLGRDADATVDSQLAAVKDSGFQNDGDNEITGIHVSDGDATASGLLGTKIPTAFANGWRVFYTQQHGANTTFELNHSATM
jgi:hypothetical protein